MRKRAIRLSQATARLTALAFAVAAFAVDWPWGDLQNHTHWAKVGWIPFVSPPVRPMDVVQNLLLFAPFGFVAATASRHSRPRALLRATLLTAIIAFAGEASQLYSHTRFPSATDLACNVIGATLAAAAATSPRFIDVVAKL
jgi:glycopeptide antibiotics resistance protein